MSVQIYWIESGAQHLAPLILLPSGLSGSWFLAPCLSWLGRCWGGTVKGQAKFIPCAKFFSSLHNSLSLFHNHLAAIILRSCLATVCHPWISSPLQPSQLVYPPLFCLYPEELVFSGLGWWGTIQVLLIILHPPFALFFNSTHPLLSSYPSPPFSLYLATFTFPILLTNVTTFGGLSWDCLMRP